MIRIVHFSDNHIGASFKSASYAGDFALKRQKEIKETLFKVVEYSNKRVVDYIIISGDLFDSEYMKMSDVNNVFKKLGDFQGQVLLITGNHDPIKQDSFWNTIEYAKNIYVFKDSIEKVAFPNHNLMVYGHSWNRYYITDKVFDNIENIDKSKINVLIAHGDIYSKKSKYLPIDKKNLISLNFDYVALGHIHKNDFITERIAYPGSLEPLDFSETGQHGFIYIELDNEKIKTEFVPYAKRQFVIKSIVLDGEMSENEIYESITNIDSTENKSINLYRIIFEGRYNHQINLNSDNLKKLFSDEFTYIEFKNEAKFDFDIEQIKLNNQDNIIGSFIEKFETLDMEVEVNKRAFNIGLELLLTSKEGLL